MIPAVGLLMAAVAGAAEPEWQTDPSHYFLGERPEADVTYIQFGAFDSGFVAGFAVGEVCATSAIDEQQCAAASRRIVVRVVRRLDTPMEAVEPHRYSWMEAALETCPIAVQGLRRLPNARWAPHMRTEYQEPQTTPEQMLITTFEGAWAIVTASAGNRVSGDTLELLSGRFEFHGNADGSGNPADWAEQFLTDIEPCLRPATVSPPWAR